MLRRELIAAQGASNRRPFQLQDPSDGSGVSQPAFGLGLELRSAFVGQPEIFHGYVQNFLSKNKSKVEKWLNGGPNKSHVYICGLKQMEVGIDSILRRMKDRQGNNMLQTLKKKKLYHKEVY